MITCIPYETLYESQQGWLQSRFHFSFAQYHNPENIHFGVLRVMNDDVIAPKRGFEMHPHRDMEIFTYVLEGELTHKDSMGNEETLYAGDIQYMSAGSGVLHSEKNESNAPLHLIQTWIIPNQKGVTPRYGSYRYMPSKRTNQWEHLFGQKGLITLYQDVNVYASYLEATQSLDFDVMPQRKAYLKVMQGEMLLNGKALKSGDSAEIFLETIHLEALSNTHILLIEMAQ